VQGGFAHIVGRGRKIKDGMTAAIILPYFKTTCDKTPEAWRPRRSFRPAGLSAR
jgi:hypothetical protein